MGQPVARVPAPAVVVVAPSPANTGLLALFGFVLAHNVIQAGRGREMLSEAVDRHRAKHPLLVNGVIILTAAHLLRRIPKRLDAWHWLALINTGHVQRRRRRTRISLTASHTTC